MKFFLIISVLFTLCISCKENCEHEEGFLTSEERSWLSYSGGETLVFKSNSNLYDTYRVREVEEFYTPISIGSTCDCSPKQQSAIYRIENNSNSHLLVALNTRHKNEWSPDGKAFIAIAGTLFYFDDFNPQDSILVNGNYYNSVYIMNADSTSLGYSSNAIWRIFYTKQNGILRFDRTQGEQWEKVN